MKDDNGNCPESNQPDMEVAWTANGEMEANALKSVLEAAGIPTRLECESASKLFVVTVDGLGAVKIMVPADRVDEAKEILRTPPDAISEDTE